MRFRKLRIAWSVGWGVACLLLIALWVRSYWWVEGVSVTNGPRHSVVIGSCPNVIAIQIAEEARLQRIK